MPRDFQDLPDAELAVLNELWDRGPATIRQLTDSLYPEGTGAHYATVQKLLERLEGKGCVARDRRALAHVFAPSWNATSLSAGVSRRWRRSCVAAPSRRS